MNEKLKLFLDSHLKTDTNTVSVFPLACGVGKTEYIRYLIADALNNNYGLIIVTDEVERLNNYTNSSDEQLSDYINRNINRVSILTSDSIASEAQTMHKKPIILMCTQRYFDLSIDEIRHLTTTRKKVIFDEKPYIFVTSKITIETLNDIDTALNEGLDDTVNQNDKAMLIVNWKDISSGLQKALKDNEDHNLDYKKEDYFTYSDYVKEHTSESFFECIKKYRSQLKKYKSDVLKTIDAVKQLTTEGIITSQKTKFVGSGNAYNNYFTVLITNVHKLTDIGASVFILDGTSDISPDYDLNCFKLIDCNEFKPDLHRLTINVVNLNTSKDKLTQSKEKADPLIKTIIEYIKSQPEHIDTVFTYKNISDKFMKDFKYVNWFGNIKGSNQYREETNICQVGLNRYPDLVYMLYVNSIGQINDEELCLINRIYGKETIDSIRCRMILADIEQNLYRCKIRNRDNSKKCTYTLICNVEEHNKLFDLYSPLLQMIKTRYEPLGATINYIETPVQFIRLKSNERKTKNKTTVQKFEEWYGRQPKDRTFKRADLISECNLTASQFKDLKRTNILNNLSTDKQGLYIVK